MRQEKRLGAYGIALRENQILLAKKKSGAYEGRWGLPGGGIEYGEPPEITVVREFLEETAHKIKGVTLANVATHHGRYGERELFHIGILYWIEQAEHSSDHEPEEEHRWFEIATLSYDELTPFAARAKELLANRSQA